MNKKLNAVFAALVFAAVASQAQAHGVAGGVVVGVGAETVQGVVTGNAASLSQGSAVAGSEVIGYGSSYQHTDSVAAGNAAIGGSVGFNGAQVNTSVVNSATVSSYGNVSGNTPLTGADGSIINGTTGFASANGVSGGNASFTKIGVGEVVGIGGAAAIVGF